MNQNQKNKISAHLPTNPAKKRTTAPPATSATNTAKSTPAVGKSKSKK
jgi:hypothetical protein